MSLDRCIETLKRGELVDEATVSELCEKLKEALFFEPNVVPVAAPVTVVANVHGQLPDVLELFRVCGAAPDTNYLVAGDVCDYGHWSLETALLLVCLRLRYPARVTLLRGEHETRTCTALYGTYRESMRKFYGGERVWRCLTDAFDYLPLAALVDDRVFVVHGGLSADALAVDRIRVLERFCEPPHAGPMCDLLWADPQDAQGVRPSPRGAGRLFGPDVSKRFCALNRVDCVVRGHTLCLQGRRSDHSGLVLTVWSAPNFLGRCGNAADALEIADFLPQQQQPQQPPPSSPHHHQQQQQLQQQQQMLLSQQAKRIEAALRHNTFLAMPPQLRLVPVPDPFIEPPHGIPHYFQ